MKRYEISETALLSLLRAHHFLMYISEQEESYDNYIADELFNIFTNKAKNELKHFKENKQCH